MIPVAAILLLIVVVFSAIVLVGNPEIVNFSILGAHLPVTASGIYLNGAGAMLVLVVALSLLRRGIKRELSRRKQVRALRKAAGVKSLPTSGPASSTPAAATPTTTNTTTPTTTTPPTTSTRTSTTPSTETSAASGNAAERQALLEEAEELTGDGHER